MILMLMFSQKGTVELDVEEGTMRFAGRKVGTLKSSKSKDRIGAGLGRVPPIPFSFPFPNNLFYPRSRLKPVSGRFVSSHTRQQKKLTTPFPSRPAPPRVTVKALTIATLQCNSNLNLTLNQPSRFQNKKSEYFPSQTDQIHKISMTHPF